MNHIPIRAREQMSKMISSGMTDDVAIHAALQGKVKLLDIRTYRERFQSNSKTRPVEPDGLTPTLTTERRAAKRALQGSQGLLAALQAAGVRP